MEKILKLLKRIARYLRRNERLLAVDGFSDTVYALQGGRLYRTRDFSSITPNWTRIADGGYNFTLDIGNPTRCGLLWAEDGLYWSDTLDMAQPNFTKILER